MMKTLHHFHTTHSPAAQPQLLCRWVRTADARGTLVATWQPAEKQPAAALTPESTLEYAQCA